MGYKLRFFLFFVAMLLFNLAANFAHPVTPTIIQDLGLPDYMFGLMLAAMQISNFLFSPFWGRLNGIISSRRTLLICCAGYGVAQLLFALSRTQLAILAVRVLAGFFVGGSFVSFLTYVIARAKPEDQARFLTYSATVQAVSGAFGYLVGGILGEFSIRGTFFLQAAVLTAAGVLFRFVCEPDAVTEKVGFKTLLRQSDPLRAFLDGRHFMTGAFVLLFAVNILMNFGNTGFDQVFNYYLKDQLGLTSSYNGVIKAAVGLVSFVSNMTLCLWIIRRTHVPRSLAFMALFCTVASVGALLIPQIGAYIACSVLVYAGYAVSLPLLQHMVAAQADPAQKNLVMGFYNATKSLGGIIGSLTAGFLYGLHVKLPFLTVAITYAAATAVAMAYLFRGKRRGN